MAGGKTVIKTTHARTHARKQKQERGSERERGSKGTRERGSEGAREQGSEGARERGSEGGNAVKTCVGVGGWEAGRAVRHVSEASQTSDFL